MELRSYLRGISSGGLRSNLPRIYEPIHSAPFQRGLAGMLALWSVVRDVSQGITHPQNVLRYFTRGRITAVMQHAPRITTLRAFSLSCSLRVYCVLISGLEYRPPPPPGVPCQHAWNIIARATGPRHILASAAARLWLGHASPAFCPGVPARAAHAAPSRRRPAWPMPRWQGKGWHFRDTTSIS